MCLDDPAQLEFESNLEFEDLARRFEPRLTAPMGSPALYNEGVIHRRGFLLSGLLATRLKAQQPILAPDIDSLHQAIRDAKPGATIIMEDRVWANAEIRLEAEGTAGNPITLRAQTPGRVVLTGTSRLRISGRHLVVDGLLFRDGGVEGDVIAFRSSSTRLASHTRLTRCAVIDYNPPDASRDSKWVSLYGFRNRVDRCYFAGKTNLGATLVVWLPASGEPNHHWIEYNHFGRRPLLGVNGAETIRVGDSATSLQSSMTVVECNYFERCNGEIEIISSKSCENTYRWNTFSECEGTLTLRHGNRCVVEGNTFLGGGRPQTGGVRIIGEDHRVINNYFEGLTGAGNRASIAVLNGIPDSPLNGYFQVNRALVAHNTVVQCARPLAIGVNDGARSMAPLNCLVANNLFSGDRSPLVELIDSRAQIEWVGNLFHGAPVGLAGMEPLLLPLELGGHGYWQPAEGSVAQGAAASQLAEVRQDLLGRDRTHPADIGCIQLQDGPLRRGRLGVAETGPGWLER